MTELIRPDLRDIVSVGTHVSAEIARRGWTTEWGLWMSDDDGLHLHAKGVTQAALDSLLDGYDPLASLVVADHPELAGHVDHILSLARATDAQLGTMTQAELRHAIRDLARAFVLYVRSDWHDR